MDKQNLEREVELALYTIFELPMFKRTRCHEIARLLRRELSRSHDGIRLMDGLVSYDVDFLLENYPDTINADREAEPLTRTQTNRWTGRLQHSWLEIGEMVIDYHHVIKATPHHEFEQLLIVDSKPNLNGKVGYLPIGIEFSVFGNTFVYIPHRTLVRLRV